MSKPAIDELLDTVSGCEIDHPRFGARYGGDMSDEGFLLEVSDHVLLLKEQRNDLCEALSGLVAELDRVEPSPIEHQWPRSPMRAKAVLAMAKAREE